MNELRSPKILIVDDTETNIDILVEALREDYRVGAAMDGQRAIANAKRSRPDLILLDVMMPGINGFEVCQSLKEDPITCKIPIIFITALDDSENKTRGFEIGAVDYITKPFDIAEVKSRVKTHLALKTAQEALKSQNKILEEKVKERTTELEAARLDLIWRLGKAAEYRDTDTGNHVVRVAYYCKVLAESLGLERTFAEMIFLTSPLHDIGKIGIPDNILLKKGKLTPTEWELMKEHCSIGAEILQQDSMKSGLFQPWEDRLVQPSSVKSENPFLKMATIIAQSHHERWDGKGYPGGIGGNDIPMESRIVAVSDVYDALLSIRPYKKKFSDEKALTIMREGNGSQFDPAVFESFEKSLAAFKDIRYQFIDEGSE
jgi:putative two-component system response regulator